MNINYNLVSLIDFLGLTQGVLLGILLILGHKQNRPSLFLGLFLFTYSIELTTSILVDTEILFQSPRFFFIPTNFYFLSPALLYLYAKSLTTQVNFKTDFKTVLPGTVEFLAFTGLFLLPISVKENAVAFFYENVYHYYWGLGMTYAVFYSAWTFRLINQHQIRAKNYFSSLQNRQLQWVKGVALFLVFFASSWLLGVFLPISTDPYLYPLNSIVNVLFIYWIGLTGFRQAKVEIPLEFSPIATEKPINETTKIEANITHQLIAPTPQPLNSTPIGETVIVEEDLAEQFQQLQEWMQAKEPYTNSDLTLSDLASLYRIAPKKLSHLINQEGGVNFNQFINQYRIVAAKKMLTNPEFDHLTVVSIGYDVGFNSKASFYSVFKKFTQTTPAQFKKQQLAAQRLQKSPESGK